MLSKGLTRKAKQLVASTMAMAVASVGISLSVPTGAMADTGGTGVNISIGSGANTGGSTSTPPTNYGGGSYTSTPSGGTATISDGSEWLYVWGTSGGCAPDANGEASIGVTHHIKREEAHTQGVGYPPPGAGWNLIAYYPDDDAGYGAYWTRTLSLSGVICVYKPANSVVSEPIQCVLSTSAYIDRVRPDYKRLGTGYKASGYTVGSQDLDTCRNSQSSVVVDANVNTYSLVEAQASSLAVWTTWRTYPGIDPRTGGAFTPTLASTSAPFIVNPQRDSVSIHCFGTSHPANYGNTDWTDEPCSPHKSSNPTTTCNAQPVLFDLKPAPDLLHPEAVYSQQEDMRSTPGNSVIWGGTSIANPGRKLIFNQNPSGLGINIQSYDTEYTTNLTNTTLDIFYSNSTSLGALKGNKTSTGFIPGKWNETRLLREGALGADEHLLLSQILKWTGTREVTVPTQFTIDPITGKMQYSTRITTVPTSGSCISTATMGIDRAIGDIIN